MYAETISRVLNQVVLLSGLLAGFSFAGVVTLIPIREKGRTLSVAIAAFLIASVLLLYAAMTGILTLAYPLETLQEAQFERVAAAYPLLVWPFRLGLLTFLSGIGLSGWIRSRWVGLISTTLAVAVLAGWVAWAIFLRGTFGR